MANADDEFVNSVMQDNGINWWEMDESEWLELQRNAGAFRSFEDECIALVTFRHMVKLRERGVFDKPQPRRTRERKPSLPRALREAKQAGVNVAAATITGQGVVLTFGEAAKTDSNELDQWMEKHKNAN